MRSIVRRDDRTEYDAWLQPLARTAGIETRDAGWPREVGPQAPEARVAQRPDASAQPRYADHEDWGWPHEAGAHANEEPDTPVPDRIPALRSTLLDGDPHVPD